MKLTASEIVKYSGGQLVEGDPDTAVYGFSIDSRSVKQGDFFVPLPGNRTDGHRYIGSALEKGAAGSFFVPGRWEYIANTKKAMVKVADCLEALQKVAFYYRDRFTAPVIGVTGSSGKTTTKDLIASVLQSAMPVLKTEGNLNNHIGLPLTLLKLNADYRAAVLEMGMSALGEIRFLSSLARPQVGIITNIGEAHLEFLGSVERVAEAKSELLENLSPDGVAILNGDDSWVRHISKKYHGKKVFYGLSSEADLYAYSIEQQERGTWFKVNLPGEGTYDFYIPLLGQNNVSNALAAIAVGRLFGISPRKIFESLLNPRLTEMRMELITTSTGVKIINDVYNANPLSMRAALQILKDLPHRGLKIAILGDMLELGAYAEEAHRKIGRFIAGGGIDYLITYGQLASYIVQEAATYGIPKSRVFHLTDKQSVIEIIDEISRSSNIEYILVKGSRSLKMEEITGALQRFYAGGNR